MLDRIDGELTSRRLWILLAVAGGILVSGYFALPLLLAEASVAQNVYYNGLGALAVAGIVAGIRRYNPAQRTAWITFAAGLACYVAGDVVWTIMEVKDGDVPFPSFADGVYLSYYPFVAAALWLVVRRRSGGADRGSLIDATVVTAAAGLLVWTFLMEPYAHDRSLGLLERLTSIAYPLMDLLLLAMVARLFASPGRRTTSFHLMAAALIANLGADIVYAAQALHGTYVSGSAIDGGWLLSYVLWGLAALHPSMRELDAVAPVAPRVPTRGRLALLALAAMLAPGLWGYAVVTNTRVDTPAVVVVSAVMFLLVVVRMAGLITQIRANLEDVERLQAERTRLLEQTVRTAEAERTRLAAELHDGPIQWLTTHGFLLERARLAMTSGDAARARELLAEAREGLSAELEGLRTMMAGLRPPILEQRGLASAIRDQIDAFAQRTGIACELTVDADDPIDLDSEIVLYRILQESLANVARHAGAARVEVALGTADGWGALRIADDGAGFDLAAHVDQEHFGLAGMRARAEMVGGRMTIRSARGSGTIVEVILPLTQLRAVDASPTVAVAVGEG